MHGKLSESPSLARRVGIICYDLLLLMAVSMAYGLVYLAVASLLSKESILIMQGPPFQLGWLATIVAFYCYFWIKGGQTTGMRAWKIKIAAEDQQKPSLKQCLMRFFTAPLGWALFFTIFFDPSKRYLHERLSGTYLYRDTES